jgi:hypothetical protein
VAVRGAGGFESAEGQVGPLSSAFDTASRLLTPYLLWFGGRVGPKSRRLNRITEPGAPRPKES